MNYMDFTFYILWIFCLIIIVVGFTNDYPRLKF